MSLDALSGILSADFASSDRLARNIMVCLLLIIPAYIVWLKWTLDAKRHPRGRDPSAAELSKDEHNIISEPAAKFSGDGNHNASRATSSQDQSKAPTPKRKLPPTAYTVGWICAISTEHVAARALLDEEHEGPGDVPKNDYNNYTLGSVGEHDVVIAVLPAGEYGLAAAASVAKDLIRSFSNVRFGLMVGVGGGAPSQEHDIRLGDLVISEHGSGHGGVFQYDFGKTMQEKTFHATGYLDQPPLFLRTAVNDLKSEYKMYGHKFDQTINSILERNQRLREFRRPDPGTDRLYQSHVVHLDKEANCAMCCGNDPATLVSRRQRERHEDNPTIHYGLIASGNQVIKDATIRDKLIAEKDILCFEMEAAGLMSQFPCLVIRGICDYSDSHKNKEWQGYAAIVAAAYAKDLLCQVPKTRVKTKKSISDIFRGSATKSLTKTA
ncbi:hypothetical protein QQS21_004905 [Conoideocrella luteorostrata]|uniref:Nucleoside phosphorylase domain-containing protein n=1 Tax=Conoideocrella luteorostrata TaxID=1105319 RepID=A0AAJ0CSW8_9HYPO|nr:hypothetical protein QQS21_004905 [Conoideocrella luteorostrata]